jgi:MFS family permease
VTHVLGESWTPAHAVKRIRRIYHILQANCFASWCANVIFIVFGVVFMNELGVSLSSIFLLNVLVIGVSFLSSTFLNKWSDRLKKRKAFMLLSFALRAIGILVLALGNNVFMFVLHTIIINILNPISFDVAIIYELGETIETLQSSNAGTPASINASTRYYLKYRVFGSLGWAVTAPVAGFLIGFLNDTIAPSSPLLVNFPGYRILLLAAFIIYIVVSGVFCIVYDETWLDRMKSLKAKQEVVSISPPHVTAEKSYPQPFQTEAPRMVARSLTFLLMGIFLFQIGAGLFQTPYAIFMKTFSRGNLFYVGLSYFFSAILEVPLFSVAFWLIKKRGYVFTLSLAYLIEIIRVLLTVAAIPLGIPEIVLPLQMMSSFAFRWPALTHGIATFSATRRASGINLNFIVEKAGGFAGSMIGAIASGAGSEIETYNFLFGFSIIFLVGTETVFTFGSVSRNRVHRSREH